MNEIEILSNIFWQNKTKNKEKVIFSKGEVEYVKKEISKQQLESFIKISKNNFLSKFSIVSSVFSFIINNYFENYQGVIKVYPSHQIDLDKCLLLEIEGNNTGTFKDLLQYTASETKEAFSHKNYNTLELNLELFSNFSIQFGQKTAVLKDDISLLYEETEDSIVLTCYYQPVLLECIIESLLSNIANILSHYTLLINSQLCLYSFVTDWEKERLLKFNSTAVEYSGNKTIVELFEEQVEKSGDDKAILFEGLELSYSELNEAANQLGGYLRKNYHIKANDLVAIKLKRSPNMLIAILGILKSGAAYVPIDPEYPQDRIDYIAQDAKAKVTIDAEFLLKFESEKEAYTKENLSVISAPESLAYVIYTSGTTGRPKGAMIENNSLINRLQWMQKAYSLNSWDTLIQKTTYSFDVSVWELIWWALYGARVSVLTPGSEKNPSALIDNIVNNKVTVIHFVPSMLQVFLHYLETDPNLISQLVSLRQVFVSGEALTISQRTLFYKLLPDVSLMNLYGPTEASIDVTFYDCIEEHFVGSVPIGKPIDNTRIYILDEKKTMVPIGIAGKLYISGVGLSRGYLNKPELTSEKFVENPFEDGGRMYDTGDLARWLPDGNIEYLGRNDFQLKIRGYRIELGEIETNILHFSPAIKQVIADAKEVNGEKVLVSYYATNQGSTINKTELREYLQSKLPEYMVPGFFVELENIPLTPNGKADRKALPDVIWQDLIRGVYVAPSNENEYQLGKIWQEVLGVNQVGVTDNFFELGGHSLMVAQVLNRIYKKLGMQITFKDFFAYPTVEGNNKSLRSRHYTPIPKSEIQENYPLTPSQHRLWVLSQLEGGSQAYNMPAIVTLKGNLNVSYFEKAFSIFINRHEILRTSFRLDTISGEICQYVAPKEETGFKIEVIDFTEKNEADIEEFLQAANAKTFNLEQSPLIRATLLKKKKDKNLFLLSMHHIIGDGWSTEVLISEVVGNYNKLLQEGDIEEDGVEENELSIQYKDYAVWLQKEIKSEKYQIAEKYWLKQFEGELPVLELPSYNTRPLIRTYNGNSISHLFSEEFTIKLKTYSAKHECTLFMVLMAGIKALLYRYSGQKDIIVGTPIAGREHPDLENQIGLYINTLVIRTVMEDDNNTFESLLQKEKSTLFSAYEHQMYPFDELVTKLNIKRDTSRSALFDVMVVFQNQSQLKLGNTKNDIKDLEIEKYEYRRKTAQFDVTYNFSDEGKHIKLDITYNRDIYDAPLINRMFNHFENLISLIIDGEDSDIGIEEIDFLTEKEHQQLIVEFNDIKVTDSENKTIIDRIEAQASQVPDNIALVFGDVKLTYRELHGKVNHIASILGSRGISPGDNVIVSLPLYPEKAIVSALSIMKLGAVYVPVEPDVPDDRLRFIVEDVQAKIAIVDLDTLSGFSGLLPLLEIEKTELLEEENSVIKNRSQKDEMAYIIYTSGSTGNPKGVMISHSNLSDYFDGLDSKISIAENNSFAMMSTISTDLGNTVLYSSLIHGKTLHVFTRSQLRDVEYIKKYFSDTNVDCLKIVPSYWKELVQDKNTIDFPAKMIIFGGEELNGSIITNIRSKNKGISIINHYGPTETTIGKLLYNLNGKSISDKVPIGNVFGNNLGFVVDPKGNLCPLGVVGELLISGKGVSRGYINNKPLTNASFIDYRLNNPNSKAYKTGDLVYRNEEGDIIYVGREDNQVKILGNRIEFGEIEKAVNTFPGIIDSVTHILLDEKGEKKIVSYIVTTNAAYQKQEIKQYLKNKLPYFMVPHIIHPIDAIPLSSNGKVNRKALPKPQLEIASHYSSIPQNDLEREIAEVWAKILNKELINTRDNFFEIGGNSLKGVRFVNYIRKKFNLDFGLEHIFHYPTIAEIADFIEKAGNKQRENVVVKINQKEGELFELSSNQRRLWVLSHDENTSRAYNITSGLLVEGELNLEKLVSSYQHILNKYDSFRSSFIFDGERPMQRIQHMVAPVVEIVHGEYIDENQLQKILEKENDVAFDLEIAPLSRLKIYSISPAKHFLVLKAHHIITDGWSTGILIHEWFNSYKKLYHTNEPDQEKSEYSYQDFVNWQKDFNKGEKIKEGERYWNEKLNSTFLLNLEDYDFFSKVQNKSNITTFKVEDHVYEHLKLLSVEYKISVYSILLSSYYLTLYYITKQRDIALGTSVAGRPEQEFENVIGFFVNTIPITTHINPKYKISEYAKYVYKNITDDISHQYVSLESIISNIGTHLNELFQGRFVLNEDQYNFSELIETTNIKSVKLYTTDTTVSKFDHSMVMRISGNSLSGSIEYKSDKFSGQYMEFITKAYLKILEIFIENPDAIVEENAYLVDMMKKEYIEKKQNKSFENFLKSIK